MNYAEHEGRKNRVKIKKKPAFVNLIFFLVTLLFSCHWSSIIISLNSTVIRLLLLFYYSILGSFSEMGGFVYKLQ